jgi:23S rRNA-intervening sequence protein
MKKAVASDEWLEEGLMAFDSAKPTHYKELIVWQKGMELAKAVYRLTARFPAEEKYGLATQMRRTAVAVPSAIAEGQARCGTQEFIHLLSRASGFLAEPENSGLAECRPEFLYWHGHGIHFVGNWTSAEDGRSHQPQVRAV